jgi:hypothetical protein
MLEFHFAFVYFDFRDFGSGYCPNSLTLADGIRPTSPAKEIGIRVEKL